ncbi:MAG: hypothetical protein Tsb005_20190 [Gammaproteobacteria bacterium]
MQTITQITQKELKLSGHTIIDCDISDGTTIIIQDGKLEVNARVGKNVNINVSGKKNTINIQGNNFNFGNITINQLNTSGIGITNKEDGSVIFNGPIEDNLCLTATGDITCNDNMGNNNQLQTHNGNICFKDSGDNCFFKTHNGNVKFDSAGKLNQIQSHNGNIKGSTIAEHTNITTHNGDVKIDFTGSHCSLKTHNGNVKVQQKGENTILKTTNGNTYINDEKQKAPNKKSGSTTSISITGNNYTVFNANSIQINNFTGKNLKKEKGFVSSSSSDTDSSSSDDDINELNNNFTKYTSFN